MILRPGPVLRELLERGTGQGKGVHTVSQFNLSLCGEVWALVQVKVQSAIAEMADSRGPKAKPDMRTEELPGMDRVSGADMYGSVICGPVVADPGRVPREWTFLWVALS